MSQNAKKKKNSTPINIFTSPLRSLILYSRKFPSGTFEQVSQLVREVVALTEECCAEGADPNCYDTRVSVGLAISTMAQRKERPETFLSPVQDTLDAQPPTRSRKEKQRILLLAPTFILVLSSFPSLLLKVSKITGKVT